MAMTEAEIWVRFAQGALTAIVSTGDSIDADPAARAYRSAQLADVMLVEFRHRPAFLATLQLDELSKLRALVVHQEEMISRLRRRLAQHGDDGE